MKYEKPVLRVFLADEARGDNCYSGSTAAPLVVMVATSMPLAMEVVAPILVPVVVRHGIV